MAPASQPPTPQLSPNPPGIRSGRAAGQLRPVTLTPDYVATAEGSVLISIGHTRVLCNATVEQGVPAYIVFGDATLRGIALTKPSSLEQLGTISGVGEKKLESYGAGVLDVVSGGSAAA